MVWQARYALLPFALSLALPGLAHAQDAPTQQATAGEVHPSPREESPPAGAASEPSRLDSLWDAARVHEGADGDALNELRVVGRFHVDNYVLDSEQGEDSDLLVRRARIGVSARMFDRLEANVQVDLDLDGGGPVYGGLTEAYVAWAFTDAAKLLVGKHSAEFTLDGSTSSNRLLTTERSNVANNFWFPEEYIPGVSLQGADRKLSYNIGVFSGGEANREFGNFNAEYFVLASVGRDLSDVWAAEVSLLRFDYVYNKPDAASTFTRPYEHIAALVAVLEYKGWGVSGDVVMGEGFPGQSDGYGATVVPWVNLSDRLQLVSRYAYMRSEDSNGLRLGRYENVVSSGRGDRYHELYGGLNWLIYGHKLKLQTGLTYANMRDRAGDGGAYDGLSWTTALRVSW